MPKIQGFPVIRPEIALEILNEILVTQPSNSDEIERIKRRVVGKYQFPRVPGNTELLAEITNFPHDKQKFLREILRVREIRTLSGIAVVAVMTKPSGCPGNCIYCPGGEETPKSYTGKEPATMRGLQNKFDPKEQVKARIKQLEIIGHNPDKIHLVIQGGTFLAQEPAYREFFIKNCLDGISNTQSRTFTESIIKSETSIRRCVGITVETRPDYCRASDVDAILELGGTWVEIGVQTLSDEIYRKVNRGHTVKDTIKAIQTSRDAGLKVTVHMMPNLFQNPYEDKIMFDRLFNDADFKPDAVKIYPTLVLENTLLHTMWENGTYVPYSEDNMIDVLAHIKARIPEWVRIQRVQRDIPAYLIKDGVIHGNLREMVQDELKKRNQECKCIRCREIGIRSRLIGDSPDLADVHFHEERYSAGEGTEHFLSVEGDGRKFLFGFLRLRNPSSSAHRPEFKDMNTLIIRE